MTWSLYSNAKRLDFEYDWKGRRIRKRVWDNTSGTGTAVPDTTFVYDGWNLLAEVNTSHSAIRSYMWGLDLSRTMQGAGGVGGLVAVNDASQGAHFVAVDANGNVPPGLRLQCCNIKWKPGNEPEYFG